MANNNRQEVKEQVVPYNLETEKAVLGIALVDNNTIIKLSDELKYADFYDRKHQIIFQAMINIYRQEMQIDYNTLIAELESKNQLAEAGGAIYLASIIEAVYTTAYVDDYIKIIQDSALKRNLMAAAESITQAGFDPNLTSAQYVDYTERIIMELTQKRRSEDLIPADVVVDNVDQMIASYRNKNAEIIGLTSGYPKLDEITLGLQKGNLIILAARPAMGKSAFAMNVATKACQKAINDNGEKAHVALFSLEMSKEQIVQRMIASLAHVDLGKIQRGNLSQKEMMMVQSAYTDIRSLNMYFSDQGTLTVSDIRAKCRKQKANVGLDLVVIDYLQLINGTGGKSSNRQEEVSQISRSLKQMARELEVPVIALAQLSRDVEKREDKRPTMADLRESGSIEQDADIVMFLYRDDYYHKGTSTMPNIAELIIAKNRNGVSGTDVNPKFLFQGEYQLFTTYEGI